MDRRYLFVHFREKTSPDGEQVHFAVSRDGLRWEAINDGKPVLWSDVGERGVRDFTIARLEDGRFVIVATDLSLALNFKARYHASWPEISRSGSRNLVLWESNDLIHWSGAKLISFESENFGCLWAPDILRVPETGDYLLHWSSSHASDDYQRKRIYCARTSDFRAFTKPQVLCEWAGGTIIDSATAIEDGRYYMFVKSEDDPRQILLMESADPTGPYVEKPAFGRSLEGIEAGKYEAPAIYRLPDGRWCLMLDFYGVAGEGQGYVPLVADSLRDGVFRRADGEFSFPYRFKHGSVLEITPGEYERIKNHDFSGGGAV